MLPYISILLYRTELQLTIYVEPIRCVHPCPSYKQVSRKESWTRHVSDPRMIHNSVTNNFVMLNLLRLILLLYFTGQIY